MSLFPNCELLESRGCLTHLCVPSTQHTVGTWHPLVQLIDLLLLWQWFFCLWGKWWGRDDFHWACIPQEWASNGFQPLCLDMLINAVYLADLAKVLGSSQSALLICRPCSLLLGHPVKMGQFLFYFIQRGFVIQYLCPWFGNVFFFLLWKFGLCLAFRTGDMPWLWGCVAAERKRKKRESLET